MFEIGQTVRVRPDLSVQMEDVNSYMLDFAGVTVTIIEVVGVNLYRLREDMGRWIWTNDMLTAEKPKPVKPVKLSTPKKWTSKTREQSVKDAIESIKSSFYAGTYIKGELEAELGRNDQEECDDCSGSGSWNCDSDHDNIEDDDGNPIEGQYEVSCDRCEAGSVECGSCEGRGSWGDSEWSNSECRDFMLNHVSQACKEATVYYGFVVDGSVDSEFNFTIPIDHPEYFIEYINAFNLLAEEIGNGLDVRGAGMHISILRSETGDYPRGNGHIDSRAFDNFSQNMNKLMPALLLLASPDHKSRSISAFRRPRVGNGDHGSAVDVANHGRSGVLEWRVFETCYNRPEMFYDYLCTIAKGLAYYHPNVKPVAFKSRIGKIEFLDDHAKYGVHKYFHTEKHLKALDEGLAYLIPDHRTVEQAKRIRNFTLTPEKLKIKAQRIAWRVEDDYRDYAKKRPDLEDLHVSRYTHNVRQNISAGLAWPRSKAEWAELEKNLRMEYRKDNPVTKRAYINKKIKQTLEGNCSRHSITI